MSRILYLYKCLSFSAEINDMSICYVLRDGDNATNDIFYFSIEDNGKLFYLNVSSWKYPLTPLSLKSLSSQTSKLKYYNLSNFFLRFTSIISLSRK